MSDIIWTSISRDRLIAEHPDGFYIIRPRVLGSVVPVSCPICHLLMRTSDDSLAFSKFDCCDACAARWAEPRREEWADGWRPSDDVVEKFVKARTHNVPRVMV